MRFSYNKLWKLLIDKGMSKQELGKLSKVSSSSIAKLGKGANVNSDVLLRICVALKCEIGDIMEIIEIESEKDEENEDDES